MLALMLMAQITAGAAPPLSTSDALRMMTPAALADQLLEPGHPPVVAAMTGISIIWKSNVTLLRVTFTSVATAAPERRWCRRALITVMLEPVDPAADVIRDVFATRVVSRETHWAYRSGRECGDQRATFFDASPGQEQRQMAVVRLLADARRRARARQALGFSYHCVDRPMPARCQAPNDRRLLATLPVERVSGVAPADARGLAHVGLLTETGDTLDAEIEQRDGRLIGLILTRNFPPPS